MKQWLHDNFKFLRWIKGGRWACKKGMWEREKIVAYELNTKQSLYGFHWKRGFVGIGPESDLWRYDIKLEWNDSQIDQQEDYTK